MDDFEMDDGGGEDEGQIALDALKEMRGVLRAAMSRMPQAAAEEPEAPITEALEGAEPEIEAMEEEAPIEEAPAADKMTVLEHINPKYGGGAAPPPGPSSAFPGKLKAKKKGF